MVAQERMSDERLCWLAVQERLRRHRSTGARVASVLVLTIPPLLGVLAWDLGAFIGGAVLGFAIWSAMYWTRTRVGANRLPQFSLAVHEVVRELSPQERTHLRATGQVPPWFLKRVIAVRRAT